MIGTINKALVILILGLGSLQANAANHPSKSIVESQRTNPTYQAWDKILQSHVTKSGVVDYQGIKADPAFPKVIQLFENTDVSSMSQAEAKVFWINAYNLFTIKLIVDNYPVKSITDIAGGKPWDKKFIHINGKTYSLNNIENDILRKKYHDPRIHFAINCASYSCPPLYNRAFFVGSEDNILNMLAKNFVNDSKRNKLSPTSIQISPIFDWYKDDFVKKGTIISFLNHYSNTKIHDDAKVSYMTYNWSLNNK